MCLSVYGKNGGSDSAMCSAVGPFSMDTQKKHLESTAKLTHIEGPDSGVFPSHGSLTCISYTASLVTKDKAKTYLLESHNEFEFEIGTGAVSNQLESCVTQLSVNQTARFVAELPPRDLIMAASCEFSPGHSFIMPTGWLYQVLDYDWFEAISTEPNKGTCMTIYLFSIRLYINELVLLFEHL
jgi:hypothetical protein